MSIIHQPHDKFATSSLKQIAIARDFFKAHLPAAIYQRLDLTSLQTVDKNYISPEMESLRGDIVYRCQIDSHDSYLPILLLIEHQSRPDRHMAFRLWQYTLRVMQDHLDAGHDQLPIVLPLCLYHGKESPYPHSTDIYDDFADRALARQLVFQPFHLIDLTQIAMSELETHGVAALMEILLRSYRDQQIIQQLQQLAQSGLLRQTIQQTGPHFLEIMLHYLVECGPEEGTPSSDQLIELLNTALPDQRQLIMTFKEQFKEQGRQEGRQEGFEAGQLKGFEAGRLEAAKSMLMNGISLERVQSILHLKADQIAQLQEDILQ